MTSIETKFVAFLRSLSPSERLAVLPSMEKWIEISGRPTETTYARAAETGDMDTYKALRQQRGL